MKTVYIRGEPSQYPNYQRAIHQAGGRSCFGKDFSGCDALLLPGGGDLEPWRYGQENTNSRNLDPERDTAEMELVDFFLSAHKPVLGICRGLQTINVFFGGTLIQDISGHGTVNGMDRLHLVRSIPSPITDTYCGNCMVNSAHHQAVERLGSGLTAVQWADDGIIEAIVHQKYPIYGVQWHPERLENEVGNGLMQAFLSIS